MPRILLVDDNAMVLGFLEHLLTARGYKVTRVASGFAALEFGTLDFDGAIIDLNLGGMSGLEVCRILRSQFARRGADLPVWLLTGALTPDVAEKAQRAGARSAFAKPLRLTQLFDALRSEFNPSEKGP